MDEWQLATQVPCPNEMEGLKGLVLMFCKPSETGAVRKLSLTHLIINFT